MKRETTKACPRCGSSVLHLFTSMQKKRCADCGLDDIPWHLAPGQKPLIGPSRKVQ